MNRLTERHNIERQKQQVVMCSQSTI